MEICSFLLFLFFSLPHSVKASLSLSPTGPGQVGSSGGSPTSKMGYCGGVPVEDMQSLTIASLSAADVAKQYEHIRELGKGTYGKVDLVAHRMQGQLIRGSRLLKVYTHFFIPELIMITQQYYSIVVISHVKIVLQGQESCLRWNVV